MIPKKIHYCWFGHGKMSPLMKKCLKSWKKYCPDYEIIEWNEDNFDVNATVWTKEAYEAKKWAFVSDYVRLKVLYEHGGVYMDTDQELIKPLTPFLKHKAFLGFMDDTNISMGLIGAKAGSTIIAKMLSYYDNKVFVTHGKEDLKPNTNFITDILIEKGLVINDTYQIIDGLNIYPQTYFCPTSCVNIENKTSKDTVALHHWAMTWRKKSELKNFAKVRRHQTKWYRFFESLRYLPNRIVRKLFGDDKIDAMKKQIKR